MSGYTIRGKGSPALHPQFTETQTSRWKHAHSTCGIGSLVLIDITAMYWPTHLILPLRVDGESASALNFTPMHKAPCQGQIPSETLQVYCGTSASDIENSRHQTLW
ncbi:MAG: hypothetical protein WCD18_09010 [Thermosynechococcaceae cyanobacterium]